MIPPRTWGCYATRAYLQAQRTGHTIHDRRAFEEHVAVDGMRRLSDQALAWLTDFVLTPERLAECLIDGRLHPSIQRRR